MTRAAWLWLALCVLVGIALGTAVSGIAGASNVCTATGCWHGMAAPTFEMDLAIAALPVGAAVFPVLLCWFVSRKIWGPR